MIQTLTEFCKIKEGIGHNIKLLRGLSYRAAKNTDGFPLWISLLTWQTREVFCQGGEMENIIK